MHQFHMYRADIFYVCLRHFRGPMGMIRALKEFQNYPGGGDILKECMWMFGIDYVTQKQ